MPSNTHTREVCTDTRRSNCKLQYAFRSHHSLAIQVHSWWHHLGKALFILQCSSICFQGLTTTSTCRNGADDDPPTLVNYPADYEQVLSIAAVDLNHNWASFSTYNQHVNMAAVGVDVLSTYPLPEEGTRVEIVSPEGTFAGIHMIYSRYTSNEGVTGILVDCGTGNGPCPGDGGHVCVIERGGDTYHNKVLKCEHSNGAAVIIYGNDENNVQGNMGHVNNSPRFTSIPAVGVRRDVGLRLLGLDGHEVTVTSPLVDGYGTLSGTSMA